MMVIRTFCVQGLENSAKSISYRIPSFNVSKVELFKKCFSLFQRSFFEMEATLPFDHQLTIQVWDFDSTSSDDLIGETKIDIENRFFSKHRAHCGLSKYYDVRGYNVWRDNEKPVKILQSLCQQNGLPQPEFVGNKVIIGENSFEYSPNDEDLQDTASK